MATIRIHSPLGRVADALGIVASPPSLGESRLGILENGNENALFVMKAIAAAMAERRGTIEGANAHFQLAQPDPRVLDEVAAKNDWVIVGGAD